MSRRARIALCACLVLLTLFSPLSSADTVDAINGARSAGCGGRKGLKTPWVENPRLNAAARRMARGASLRDALGAEDYLGIKSTSVRLGGSPGNSAVARVFRKQFCDYLLDTRFAEIGLHRESRGLWFVIAQPFPLRALDSPNKVNRQVLELINQARGRPRRCGGENFAAAPPLVLTVQLSEAALAHSKDMARRNYFEHEGKDGSIPADRVTRQGYRWRTVGENLAAGTATPEATVQGWLDSPHHCANLMSARFTQTGIAYAINSDSQFGIYWTQVFATPK